MSNFSTYTNPKNILVGVQFLFVAFGATVLVPLLTGIDPSVALFAAGVGTLLFHFITKGKVPVYLGSSFAFIAPIQYCVQEYGMAGALSGIIAVGAVYSLVSMIVKSGKGDIIQRLFPSVVVGPVIMVIGLSLSKVGVDMASSNWPVALISLVTAIAFSVYGKGMMKLIPIVAGLVVGYIASLFFGIVDFTPIQESAWIALPKFVMPEWNTNAILYMLPVAVAPIIEHIGDMYAISAVAEKNFTKDPGLHRTLLGDGVATAFAGFVGGPPNTTYSEVTGAIQLTKMTNPAILRITAVTAIVFSVVGKLSGFLKSIPTAVLGGIMLLLFGMIASVGIKTLIEARAELEKTRSQVIVSLILTIGIGGAVMSVGEISLSGIGLASLVGVILNLILPDKSKPVAMNGKSEEA